MANGYYNSPADIAPVTRARSVDINTIDQGIDAAFDKLPAEDHLKRGTVNFAATTGAVANTYEAAMPYAPTAYVDGMAVNVKFHAANTGTDGATLNINGLGPKSIKRFDGSTVKAGDLQGVMDLRYNGTSGFFHVGPNALAAAAEALASQNAAKTSETNAASSAGSASSSASTASTKASEAATSATNAATKASEAATSATNSANSATASSNSATSASNSASTATTKASEAATSATNAATKAGEASTSATNAASSAQTALNAPGTNATSATSLAIGTGAKSLTIQTNKALVVGMTVKIAATASPTNWMVGDITAYNASTGALTVNVNAVQGAGTFADWTVSLAAAAGTTASGKMFFFSNF